MCNLDRGNFGDTDSEQMNQKTWAERLKETQELARQREDQLKLLGLVTDADDLKAQSATVRLMLLSSASHVHLGSHTSVVVLLL